MHVGLDPIPVCKRDHEVWGQLGKVGGKEKRKGKSIIAKLSNFPGVRGARQFRASHSNRRQIKIPENGRANRWRVTIRKIKGATKERSRGGGGGVEGWIHGTSSNDDGS